MQFDIVMPTFKRQHCINQTIDTIINQSYNRWRLIIIDNDGSIPYHYSDPRIECYIHSKIKGAAYARNCGITYTQSDIVCFFDDDDYMHHSYLEEFSHVLAGNAKMAVCWMDANHNKQKLRHATPCCAIRREFVTPTWQNSGQLQDQKYYRSIINRNKWTSTDIAYIDKVLVFVGHSNKGGLRHTDSGY